MKPIRSHVAAAALTSLPPSYHASSDDALRADELAAILDTTAEGMLTCDAAGLIQSCSRSAEALFGLSDHEIARQPLADLFAPESQRDIMNYLQAVKDAGVASLLDHGRDVLARARDGGGIARDGARVLVADLSGDVVQGNGMPGCNHGWQ